MVRWQGEQGLQAQGFSTEYGDHDETDDAAPRTPGEEPAPDGGPPDGGTPDSA